MLKGKNNPSYKHGNCGTRLYKIWARAKARCHTETDNGYKDYGGRGIKMCEEWKNSFAKFKKHAMSVGYKKILTIDRINNDKGYYPGNIRFVTMKIQGNNKRIYRKTIVYEGMIDYKRSLELGKHKSLIRNRLRRGWDIHKAFNAPARKYNMPGVVANPGN